MNGSSKVQDVFFSSAFLSVDFSFTCRLHHISPAPFLLSGSLNLRHRAYTEAGFFHTTVFIGKAPGNTLHVVIPVSRHLIDDVDSVKGLLHLKSRIRLASCLLGQCSAIISCPPEGGKQHGMRAVHGVQRSCLPESRGPGYLRLGPGITGSISSLFRKAGPQHNQHTAFQSVKKGRPLPIRCSSSFLQPMGRPKHGKE